MSTYNAGYKNIRGLVDQCRDEESDYAMFTKSVEKNRDSLLEAKTVAESLIVGHNRALKVKEKKAEENKEAEAKAKALMNRM